MRGVTGLAPAALRAVCVICALFLALCLITACDSPTGGGTKTGAESESEGETGKKPGSGSGGGGGGGASYTITFDTQGGSPVASITAGSGSAVNKPADPARTGFVFLGWYTAETGGTAYTWPHPLSASVTMHAQWLAVISSVTGVTDYLNNPPSGTGTKENPVPLAVGLNLASDWTNLLTAIAGKYVALDLSACEMSGTEFDPDNTNSAGADKIVSLVLPDNAAGIKAGTFDSYGGPDATFKHFTSLTSVSGENVETIGELAFSGCTALTTVSLPATLTNIDPGAFAGCTRLMNITVDSGNPSYRAQGGMLLSKDGATLIAFPTTGNGTSGAVTLPEITRIFSYAFNGCTALTTVSLPVAETIGEGAFFDCPALTMVSLPTAQTIGVDAFAYCSALTTVSLPAAQTIDREAFRETSGTSLIVTLGAAVPTLGTGLFSSVSAKTVTVQVPAGANAWNGKTGSFSGSDTTPSWGNGFRGGGWKNGDMTDRYAVRYSISLSITTDTP